MTPGGISDNFGAAHFASLIFATSASSVEGGFAGASACVAAARSVNTAIIVLCMGPPGLKGSRFTPGRARRQQLRVEADFRCVPAVRSGRNVAALHCSQR